MAVNPREIKARLSSIKNTKKITHTMELVSAAKMRRAVSAALASRTYSALLWDILRRVQAAVELPEDKADLARWFTQPHNNEKYTVVVFTSNRGLCGAFNSGVVKKVVNFIAEKGRSSVEVVAVGKRGAAILTSYGIPVKYVYEKKDSARNDDSIRLVAQEVYKDFAAKDTSAVYVAYTDYRSSAVQVPTIKPLYPIVLNETISEAVDNIDTGVERVALAAKNTQYIFEPDALGIIEAVLPRLAEVQLYQALLESNASEHSARMLAMKNATDAAGDMSRELSLAFNRARQAAITQEIAEISAGSAAVS